MHYLPNRAKAYEHPRHVLAGVRSILLLAMNYRTDDPPNEKRGYGRVSRYAWGSRDYHNVIHERLAQLRQFHLELTPHAQVRGVVDTAPLLERDFAQLAGLGWIGKNTMLINREQGSWFFLAALLTDQTLEYDEPHEADHCGTCRACLDACPTDAFPEPYILDATKCISYLTIELRDNIPTNLREGIGDWLFGCDVCQEVCPWNRRAPRSEEPEFAAQADLQLVNLCELFKLDGDTFQQRFRQTPLWRTKRRGILRNAAIILGNQRSPDALPALALGLNDVEPLVRSACAWALGQFRDTQARNALGKRLAAESDEDVRNEIYLARKEREPLKRPDN
jgi:epoxyqueuosine reductase